ncbi:MAG: DUF3501 family protein [Gammaproteobacteria bacterium]|jgi:hypothetical protein
MEKLTRDTLYGLEQYSSIRNDFRKKVMEHKKHRSVKIGPHATLYFEDQLTMQYQVQEMLRAEKIFEAEGIEEELAAYNPLIPDGSNWKATFMIEYDDPEERKAALAKMVGIEDRVWVQVEGYDRIFAIADEDLERETQEKTSSVHFMRFELSDAMIAAAREGARISMGIDHTYYKYSVDAIDNAVRESLSQDLH